MHGNRMIWLGSLMIALLSATLVPDQADAGWRRARRYGYGYGDGCCYAQSGPVATGCCGVAAQPIQYQPYQQTVWKQPYQQTTWQNACVVQPVGYQTYDHTTGYAPQGTQAPPPPPMEQPPQQPQTFQEAPEPGQ